MSENREVLAREGFGVFLEFLRGRECNQARRGGNSRSLDQTLGDIQGADVNCSVVEASGLTHEGVSSFDGFDGQQRDRFRRYREVV